jgi:hypothetical protein
MKFNSDNAPKGGRTPGSRNRLVNSFVEALFQDFSEHGPAAIKVCRIERPTDYLRIVAGLVPKELFVQESAYADMPDQEISETLATIRRLNKSTLVAVAEQDEESPPKGSLN